MPKRLQSPVFRTLLIYLAGVTAIWISLDYVRMFYMIPQGIHFMRQTDSLSEILHYMKTGMHFWEPGILNLDSDNGKTASEFPIFYYLFALLFNKIGFHPELVRIWNSLLVFAGFYGLFRIAWFHIRNMYLALSISFLLTGSLVIHYYTNNFLPDAGAMGLCLSGLALFYPAIYKQGKPVYHITGLLLMILAALLKVSCFMYPVIAIIVYLGNQANWRLGNWKKSVENPWYLIVFIAGTTAVIGWILFVRQYNQQHNGYFLVQARSILESDEQDRIRIFKHVTSYWADAYYPKNTKWYLLIATIAGLVFYKKGDRNLFILSILSFFASIAFFLAFFLQFADHDYYFLAMVPTVCLITIFAFDALSERFPGILMQVLLTLSTAILAIMAVGHTEKAIAYRYSYSYDDIYSHTGQQLNHADIKLDQAGISPDARIVFAIDHNINGGPYFTKRFGWPLMDTTERYTSGLASKLHDGATHMLLTDTALVHLPVIRQYLGKCVLTDSMFCVYDMVPPKP